MAGSRDIWGLCAPAAVPPETPSPSLAEFMGSPPGDLGAIPPPPMLVRSAACLQQLIRAKLLRPDAHGNIWSLRLASGKCEIYMIMSAKNKVPLPTSTLLRVRTNGRLAHITFRPDLGAWLRVVRLYLATIALFCYRLDRPSVLLTPRLIHEYRAARDAVVRDIMQTGFMDPPAYSILEIARALELEPQALLPVRPQQFQI